MKKLWISIISVLFAIVAIGCFIGGGNQNSEEISIDQFPSTDSNVSDVLDSSIAEDLSSIEDSEASENSMSTPDSESNADFSSDKDSTDAESAVPGGTVVPPITDGGNFDGTV